MQSSPQQKSTSEKKPLPKLKFQPCNTYLLCRKVEIDNKIGNIYIPDPDKVERRYEVIAASPDLLSHLDHYDAGDLIIYPTHEQPMYINIDGEDMCFLDKRKVVTKVG